MGGVRYTTKVPSIIGNAERKAQVIVEKGVRDIFAHSQQAVPVDTGNLKGSGAMEFGQLRGEVSYATPYALFVHEGTRKMAARPFLRSAFDYVAPEVEKALRKVVEP